MKIKITGATGYLGRLISNELTANGYSVSHVERYLLYGSVTDLQKELRNADVVINLSGAPILKSWTNKNKALIRESRIRTTYNLVEAINALPESERPSKFITASAIGIYKPGFIHDESSTNFDDSFIGEVVKDWEKASSHILPTVQRNVMRIGLVLGKNAKTITSLLLPFKLGLGATIGNGNQAFPFIHEKDLVNAFVWAVKNCSQNGIYNLVAPENISNKDFTSILAKKLNRPAFLFIPELVLKIILGEASVLLTEGATVESKNLLDDGFRFQYPGIESALEEILAD